MVMFSEASRIKEWFHAFGPVRRHRPDRPTYRPVLAVDPPSVPITPGIVYVVGGVGGFDHVGQASLKALPRAGVPHEIHDFVWTHGWAR